MSASDLYALPPEEFTAARDAAAKEDKNLKALRKPTVSAWVVNTLARRDSRLLDELLALGASLAEAQRTGQGEALRQLGEQRRQLVQSVTSRALELVERDVTAAARSEVESTLEAALADPRSAEAVRSGQLVRALTYAGFGGVDLDAAVAELSAPRSAPRPPRTDNSQNVARNSQKVARLEAAALESAGALDDAVRVAETAARALTSAQKHIAEALAEEEQAATRVTEAKAAWDAAEKGRVAARKRRTSLEKDREVLERKAIVATKRVDGAQDDADRRRQELDALRRS